MTALDLGPVVLGGNVFGWTADRDASFAVLDAFTAGGGRAIDTADAYSSGASETIVGEWLASRGTRDDVVLMTKIGAADGRRGLAAATIEAGIDESLRRLGTDRVDVWFAHRDDPATPQEETMAALDRVVRAGKVGAIGASNFTADRLRSAARIAEEGGLTPFTITQDRWSLVERRIEIDLLPTLEALGLAEVPHSALASGFLSGKYRPGTTVDSPRAGRAAAYLDDARDLDLLGVLDDLADELAVPVGAVALAWLAAQRTVAAPIASASRAEQVPDLLASATVRFTPLQLEELSAATEPVGG